MIYLSWVAFCEGQSDAAYFDILLPRLIDEIVLLDGTQPVEVPQAPALRLDVGRSTDEVAKELCRNAEAYHLIFIHADTGGRGSEAGMDARSGAYCREVRSLCDWPADRCVVIGPRHETEAWVMADAEALIDALGIAGDPYRHGLPADAAAAEAIPDPKAALSEIISKLSRGRSRRSDSALFARVAQEQRLTALRGSRSFQAFEADLRRALRSLGCLSRRD